jgi:hypothetical protein
LKHLTFFLVVTLTALASPSFAEPIFITVPVKNVLIYESPMTSSPIVRRVFAGEVLKVIETIKTEQGETWGKIFLSPSQVAYVQGIYLVNSSSLPQQVWKSQEVLRSEMPFSISAKGTSELFGPGLQFRYLPFTRLGITVGVGSVLDGGRAKGSSVAYGLTCILSMANLSPFVETGTSTLSFNDGHSSLRISTFYINAGVEWILRSGYFVGLGVSYNRSYNIQVGYDYSFAKESSGSLKVGNYGSFSDLGGSESLERLNPLFVAGYSF